MAGDIQRRIQLLIDGDKGGDRTAHVVEIAFKAGHVFHDFILGAGLERHGKEFHHAHRVGQTLEGGTIAVVDNISGAKRFLRMNRADQALGAAGRACS